jgi:hypothetical protein
MAMVNSRGVNHIYFNLSPDNRFLKFAVVVCTLFNQVSVSMYVNMKIIHDRIYRPAIF